MLHFFFFLFWNSCQQSHCGEGIGHSLYLLNSQTLQPGIALLGGFWKQSRGCGTMASFYLFIYQACLLSLCKWPLCRSRRQSPSLGVSWLVTSVTDKKIWWQCSRKSSYAGNLLLEYWYFQNDIPLYIYGALSGKQGDSSRNVCMTNKLWRHESCKEFIVLLETAGGDMQ